ncbi:MAG: ABC transporter ATP-binding protein [Burkholderiales bacterium]|jgi:iron(III) transport system ATP-binding protein|nr:ABC transporter ATP-binding protein [Burkholderiales bacterium]
MTEPVRVEVENVSLAFGATQVLRGIDVAIAPGEFFALLGPSGCGKSTLLRLIAGFNHAQSGHVRIGGDDVTRVPPWERNVGMVFQSYALWPHMTVAGNVAFGLEERGRPREEIRRRVADALALVGLQDLADRRPGQLSGGQQQRVALARTVAIEPRVLLLDEPLSNLDAKLRVHMRRELVQLQRKLGITTIFVTHDQEEAMTTCDRIAVMSEGRIVQTGTPVELYDAPASRFVAEFVGSINLLDGNLQTGAGEGATFVSPQVGPVPLPPSESLPGSGDVTLAFRPHGVSVSAARADPARIWLAGAVAEREFLGEFVRYRVRVGGADILVDAPHLTGAPWFDPGAGVEVGIDPREIRVLRP